MAQARFSKASIEFIEKASQQKNPNWLEKNKADYEQVLQLPMKALVSKAASELKAEAPGYRFPLRNLARLKRGADNAKAYGPFRDWVSVSASRDSGSRYDSLPNLYFHIDADDILSAGGLYMPNADQTKHIRAWIDQDPSKLEELFGDPNFNRFYSDLGRERVLKTKPRDYPLDHPRIDWLKLTGFYVWAGFTKKQFYSSEFADLLIEHWRQVLRFNAVLDHYNASFPKVTGILAMPEVSAPKLDW